MEWGGKGTVTGVAVRVRSVQMGGGRGGQLYAPAVILLAKKLSVHIGEEAMCHRARTCTWITVKYSAH